MYVVPSVLPLYRRWIVDHAISILCQNCNTSISNSPLFHVMGLTGLSHKWALEWVLNSIFTQSHTHTISILCRKKKIHWLGKTIIKKERVHRTGCWVMQGSAHLCRCGGASLTLVFFSFLPLLSLDSSYLLTPSKFQYQYSVTTLVIMQATIVKC